MEKLHYTKKLKNEILENEKKLQELNSELTNIMSYLSSDKFQGFENNYVNASEMYEIIRNLRNNI